MINVQKAHCSERTLQDFLSFSIDAIFVTHFYFVISTRTTEMMKHSILLSIRLKIKCQDIFKEMEIPEEKTLYCSSKKIHKPVSEL